MAVEELNPSFRRRQRKLGSIANQVRQDWRQKQVHGSLLSQASTERGSLIPDLIRDLVRQVPAKIA